MLNSPCAKSLCTKQLSICISIWHGGIYIVQFAFLNFHCKIYIVQLELCIILFASSNLHFTIYNSRCTISIVQLVLCHLNCEILMCNLICPIFIVKFAWLNLHCKICIVKFALCNLDCSLCICALFNCNGRICFLS